MIDSAAEDDENVVLCSTSQDELKFNSFRFSEPVTALCVDYTSPAFKKDGMFLVGTRSGRLVQYRPGVLFGKKEFKIEEGKGSAVKRIAWQQHLVAWADGEALYLFDIASQSAVGRVPSPCGLADQDAYPASIAWSARDTLLLGNPTHTLFVVQVETAHTCK